MRRSDCAGWLVVGACLGSIGAPSARAEDAPAPAVRTEPVVDVVAPPRASEAPAGPASMDDADPDTTPRTQRSSFGTRVPVDLFEVPLSVQVVSEEVFRDQSAFSLQDALRNVSSVAPNRDIAFNSSADGAIIRGFRNTTTYYDGFLVEAGSALNLPTLERIEVLKGPASMALGVMEPGGAVNVVPKRPLETPFREVEQVIASHDDYRTHLDATGPLGGGGRLQYRLNTGYVHRRSFREHVEEERWWVAPSLAWTLDAETTLAVDVSYATREKTLDEGVAFSAAGQPVAPIGTFLGEPGLPGQDQDDVFAKASVTRRLRGGGQWRTAALYHAWTMAMNGVRRSATTTPAGTVARLYDHSDFDEWSLQVSSDVAFTAAVGQTCHEVLAGIDWRTRTQTIDLNRASYTPIDIRNPVYGDPLPPTPHVNDIESDRDWASVFAQDRVDLLPCERLSILAGLRFDQVWTRDDNRTATPRRTRREDGQWTGRGGVIYHPIPMLGVFASASTSFVPTSTTAREVGGDLLDPERGRQYEFGFKWRSPDQRLFATLVGYDLVKEDVAVADTANPGFSVNGGRLRSRGVEFDVSGDIGDHVRLIGNYTRTETEVLASTSLPVGARFANVPPHSGSLWLQWATCLRLRTGFSVGAGIVYSDDRTGDDAGTFRLESFTRFDAAIGYRWCVGADRIVGVRLGVENLTDEEYYKASFANSRVFPGNPRTFVLTLSYEF